MTGFACLLAGLAAVTYIFLVYMKRMQSFRNAESRLEHLGWIETQARAGLLTDNETRRELLHLMR